MNAADELWTRIYGYFLGCAMGEEDRLTHFLDSLGIYKGQYNQPVDELAAKRINTWLMSRGY